MAGQMFDTVEFGDLICFSSNICRVLPFDSDMNHAKTIRVELTRGGWLLGEFQTFVFYVSCSLCDEITLTDTSSDETVVITI